MRPDITLPILGWRVSLPVAILNVFPSEPGIYLFVFSTHQAAAASLFVYPGSALSRPILIDKKITS